MHLTDEQLNEYLDDEATAREEIETHLASCMDCAARLSALQDLFTELESLTELELTYSIASRLTLPVTRPTPFPRSLTLTMILQAALAAVTLIIAAPFVMRLGSRFWINMPALSFGDLMLQIQAQWTAWLNLLSQFRLPAMPEIPVMEVSSLFVMYAVIGVSLLWLIGNGLLLRNQIK